MNVSQALRQQRLEYIPQFLENAGTPFTWYRYVTANAGTAAYGIGSTPVYATAQLTGIWAALGKGQEQRLAGGQVLQGDEVIYTQALVGTADRLTYGGITFEVVSEPWEVRHGDVLYQAVGLRRG